MIRELRKEDIEEVVKIYEEAKAFMIEHDNLTQWDDNYPSKSIVLEDIKNNHGYVIIDNEKIVGVFALIFGIDPTYIEIDGKWLNDNPYGTIHRIAGKTNSKGILKEAVDYALTKIDNVRIDTHDDNYVMKNALSKLGFKKCGIIKVADGSSRIAYQLTK